MKIINLIDPLRVALIRYALAGAASLALCALPAPAAPVSAILNGSFEVTTVPGDWVPAALWTEVSGLDAAYSLPTGMETIPSSDGTRFLRLQTEDSGYIARVAQNLGTMVAGETYTFRADVIASTAYGDYGATAAFVNEGIVAPTTIYATQTVNVAQGATGGFILSYTAQSADDGKDLYIWLQAEPVKGANIYTRGGIDRARLEGPSLFTENFNSYASTNPGIQYETGLPVAWGGAVTGWTSGGSGGVIHAVQLNASPNWAPMFYDADNITLDTGIAANATGISYGVTFKYGPANYGTAGQQTTAADYLLVEVLRADDSVLASGTYYPKDWSNPANANLSAGKRGLLPYVGDGSGNVRLRISGPLSARFNGEIDDLEVLQNPIVPPAVPAEPSSPSPANGAGIVGVSPTLTWAGDPLATSYQVSLGPVGDTKPATATATVTDPTYSPGTLLAGTTYQWQVVAVNANGSTPGPVWTFTTSVITYTYIYEADSVPPNVPAELANPNFLNDGLIGTTWDATTIMYYSAAQSNVQPHVTLTLAPNDGMGKLTVWYTRWDAAGLFVPASLTVSDEFGHSATTVFTLPAGNEAVFTQDVALSGMQGTVLHLSFATAGEAWLGLNEIRLFEPAPLPPEAPSGPAPLDGSIAAPVTTSLGWNNSVGATSYDVYFWNAADPEPSTATATVTTNSWTPTSGLISASEATYRWKVVAKNDYGDAAGAVWTFTTSVITYTYVYEAGSVPPNVSGELATPTILNDGVVGTTFDSTTQLYGSGTETLNKPSMTLTLSPYGSLSKLTVWYLSWTAAGVFVPDSLTVSDNFGHSATTPFAPPAGDNAVFSQDVPLTGMQGSVLHLSFTCTQYWVGLDEIKVFGTAGSGSGYDTWATTHAGGQTAEKDSDHDGVPNGVEYFMDAPDGFTENPGVVNGKVTWSRVNPVASFGVQVSDNLTDWLPANPADVDLSDPSQVIYTFPSGAAKKFCRLAVTP